MQHIYNIFLQFLFIMTIHVVERFVLLLFFVTTISSHVKSSQKKKMNLLNDDIMEYKLMKLFEIKKIVP